ncbi:hypothetical protein ACQ4PT_013279 [Festuca glaucescens]
MAGELEISPPQGGPGPAQQHTHTTHQSKTTSPPLSPAASCPALPRAAAAVVAVSAASHSSCPAPPPLRSDSPSIQQHQVELLEMAGGFSALGPKTKNLVVAGGLTGFVLGVYYYTMHAVGGTDELQVAIDKFEDLKKKDAAESAAAATKPSAPGSS